MVTTVLEKRGYEVDTAADGQDAFEKATENPPDLLITDVMMPRMDGWELVRSLRTRSDFAFTPVIFLTALSSDDDRIRGFRLGADDYLPKPFRFEELDLRVANTLKRSAMVERAVRERMDSAPPIAPHGPPPSAEASGPHTALGGSLQQVGLPSLLTLLEMERKSGILVLISDATEDVGRLFVRSGRVVRALIENRDEPRNEECVYFLLGWQAGSFSFNALDVDMEDEVNQSTTHLLMEGARRVDEETRPGF